MEAIFEQLNYDIYLAEQELHNRLAVLSIKYNGVITESNIEVLTEDVKDVVMTYINKIVAGIQSAWDKFKELINNGRYEKLKKDYGKYLQSNFILNINDPDFEVPDFDKLDELLKITLPHNLQNILEDLVDDDSFTAKHFSFVYEKDKSIKQVAESKIIKKITDNDKPINKEKLGKYIKFLDEYKNRSTGISNDVRNLNSATRSVNQIMSSGVVGEMVDLSKVVSAYFHEDENENKSDDKKQPTFSSGTQEGQKGSTNEKLKEMQKKVNIYFKVCTSVLSTKMALLNKVERISFSIAKNYAILASKEDGATIDGENKEEKKETTNGDTPEVKI